MLASSYCGELKRLSSSSYIPFFMLLSCYTVVIGLGRVPLLGEEIQEQGELRSASRLGFNNEYDIKPNSHLVQMTSAKETRQK